MLIPAVAAIACAVLVGVFFAFVLTIRKPLSDHLKVEESSLRVGRWLYLALVPAMLFGGALIDQWGAKPFLFCGLLGSAAGFSVLGMCRTQRQTIWPLLVLGIAAACVILTTSLLLPRAFFSTPPADVAKMSASATAQVAAQMGNGPLVQALMLARSQALRRVVATPTAALNLGYVFVAVGTLMAPIVVNWLCARRSFRHAMYCGGLLALIPATLVMLTPGDTFVRRYHSQYLNDVLAEPRLWIAVAMMVLYLPLERSLATWAHRYLNEMHYPDELIPRFMIGFWLFFVLARLFTALVVQPGFEMWWVLVLVSTSFITLGNLLGYYRSAQGGRGILIIGASFGPILPTILGVVLVMFPNAPATTLGIVLGLGFLSNAIFQPALVAFARNHSIQATVRIPMLAALLLAAPTLMLTLIWWHAA